MNGNVLEFLHNRVLNHLLLSPLRTYRQRVKTRHLIDLIEKQRILSFEIHLP